jgi:ATPase subunit of ABC transporter with duplicated ATPase domains
VIEARGLTKTYGDTLAVDDLIFTVHPGVVTGFLGPNRAGTSTTMRLTPGLDRPSSGSVTRTLRSTWAVLGADSPSLSPWLGLGVMIGWVVVGVGAAAVQLRRRDA